MWQGQGLGHFHDISALTMFADYRVPVVLRQMGILRYSQELAAKAGALRCLSEIVLKLSPPQTTCRGAARCPGSQWSGLQWFSVWQSWMTGVVGHRSVHAHSQRCSTCQG